MSNWDAWEFYEFAPFDAQCLNCGVVTACEYRELTTGRTLHVCSVTCAGDWSMRFELKRLRGFFKDNRPMVPVGENGSRRRMTWGEFLGDKFPSRDISQLLLLPED